MLVDVEIYNSMPGFKRAFLHFFVFRWWDKAEVNLGFPIDIFEKLNIYALYCISMIKSRVYY